MYNKCSAYIFGYSVWGVPLWLGWIPIFALLLFAYYRSKHMDPAWREKREHKHKKSVATIRQNLAIAQKYWPPVIWLIVAAILLLLWRAWEPVSLIVSKREASEWDVMRLCSKLGILVTGLLPLLVGFVLVLMNIKNQLKKLDELLTSGGAQQ